MRLNLVSLRELYQDSPSKASVLLERLYRSFEIAFPFGDEREDISVLQNYLQDREDNYEIFALLEDGEVIAACHFNLHRFSGGKAAIIEHIWVVPQERRRGLGQKVLKETLSKLLRRGVELAFAELNDPTLMSEEEWFLDATSGITPDERIEFWEQAEAKVLDMPYIQPPFLTTPGAEEVRFLMLIGFSPEATVPRKVVEEVLANFFATFASKENAEKVMREIFSPLGDSTEIRVREISAGRTLKQTP